MHFKTIHKFDIDCNQLYQDYLTVYNNLNYDWSKDKTLARRRISVTYSDFQDINDPYLWRCSVNYDKQVYLPADSYKIENIVPFFKNTYTEKVSKLVHEWFFKKGIITTHIKFANLLSKAKLNTHIDNDTSWRYFIPVSIAPGVAMICNGIRYEITETGMLYGMNAGIPHAAENNSDIDRILLFFDALKLN